MIEHGRKETMQGTVDTIAQLATSIVLIPQVRPAHKNPISPLEMIHLPGEDNVVFR
jgi:hypothetical protein